MARLIKHITPDNRVDRWKKLWATPRKLTPAETDEVFEEFQEEFVPGHMHKHFLKNFGVPKAQFGNRYFKEDAQYRNWNMRLAQFIGEGEQVLVTVIYGSPDALEAYQLRGDRRRTLRDIIIDDWQAGLAIVMSKEANIFVFVEPKMRGCMVRMNRLDGFEEAEPEELAESES